MTDQKNKRGSAPVGSSPAGQWDYFLAAIMFYTRIPVPSSARHSDQIMQRSRIYFPIIGWIVGFISVLVFLLASHVLTTTLAVILSMVASVLATGAFHEDGFADSCDSLGGGWSSDQVLTIMKDSRLGTYGVIGLVLLLLTKFLSLVELSQASILLFGFIYTCGHTVSRIFSSVVIDVLEYVQDIDKSKIKPITSAKLNSVQLGLSIALAAVPVLLLIYLFPHMMFGTSVAVSAASFLTFVVARYAVYRIGGYTGDILGAIQQLAEIVFYLTILAFL